MARKLSPIEMQKEGRNIQPSGKELYFKGDDIEEVKSPVKKDNRHERKDVSLQKTPSPKQRNSNLLTMPKSPFDGDDIMKK